MTIVASNDPRILSVEVADDLITAHLADGRTMDILFEKSPKSTAKHSWPPRLR